MAPPSHFPPADASLQLASEELAAFLLAYLQSQPDGTPRFHRSNILNRLAEQGGRPFAEACAEAWSWLERTGLLIFSLTGSHEGVFELSRGARAAVTPSDFERLRQAALLPREMLHPGIAVDAWGLFIVGKFELAVFAAFKSVEIAVATNSGCEGQGVSLMRAAFRPETGPLSDKNASAGEQEAMMHLFAGAIGSFRNPVGHREVRYADAREPAEQLCLASHLLRVVDAAST